MRFKLVSLMILTCCTLPAWSQESSFIRQLIESLSENLPEDFDVSAFEEHLIQLQKQPINLNRTTVSALNELRLLSPLQTSSLFAHIATNGKLIDVLELQSIDEFSLETIERLMPFITVDAAEPKEKITIDHLVHLGSHDLLIRSATLVETQKGFTDLSGSKYLGTKVRMLAKYKFQFSNRLTFAVTMEKDAGEKLLSGKAKLPDFIAGHLGFYQLAKIEKLIIGDYTLQFGQGLTLWSGFTFGKGPDVASVVKRDDGLKAYSAANEYNFQRGLATSVHLSERFKLTSFGSHRQFSASPDIENSEQVISTINETGLHRTGNEIKNKGILAQTMFGAIIELNTNNFGAGVIAYQSYFDHRFVTGEQSYKLFKFTGKSLTNLGFYYHNTFKNFYFFGESGKALPEGLAYLNGVLASLSSKASMVLIHRNYQRNYHNFYNQAIAESAEANNETGFYCGFNLSPIRVLSISLYADYFRFPWLKFLVDAPADGHELFGQVVFKPTKQFNVMLRYKEETKAQNATVASAIHFLETIKKVNYRAEVNWQLTERIKLQHHLEVSQFKQEANKAEFGYLFYQDIAYQSAIKKLAGNLRIAYFDTPSYNSRIYAYEEDVLYSFSFGMYSGQGFRTYLNLKYKLLKKLDIWSRSALFFYPKAKSIGSGLEEINGNTKTELKFQLRYQF